MSTGASSLPNFSGVFARRLVFLFTFGGICPASLKDQTLFSYSSRYLREANPYHFSCFFIKFINGLWPPPLFYKVTLWIFFDFFIKLRCEFFSTFFRLFPHWIWFLDIQNRFYFIVKRLKNSFLICLRRPFLCQFHVAKALQNI